MYSKNFLFYVVVVVVVICFFLNPMFAGETIQSDMVVVVVVVVLEKTAHVGGIIAGGLTNADIITKEGWIKLLPTALQWVP